MGVNMLLGKKIMCMKDTGKGPSIVDIRARVEKQRMLVLKDNLNKLASIASVDMKMVYDALVELDTVHKQMFEQDGKKKTQKKETQIENIFLQEDE